ncbi:uncharacterized protein ARMOST_17925 [Armillaria ostoyae]|uniref:F-box domain-containing protein n=1 Tax=Armillaria ostoyae TaxID=47428 RepID=A0A284S0D3_ARMOS|nr:uncharacterized protein ARMOST_17925 [Armillaria ostoyae]
MEENCRGSEEDSPSALQHSHHIVKIAKIVLFKPSHCINRMSVLSSNPPLRSIEDLVKETTTKYSLSIPPELIEEIIDHLWDSKDVLFACSFVCRLFYLRTRVHLFHSMKLKQIPHDEPSFQHILPCIRKIAIRRHASDEIPSVAPFLSSLPNLTALHLDRLEFSDPWSLHHLVCQLRGLTSLDLRSPDKPFPRINKITIRGTFFDAPVVGLLIHRRELRAIYVDSLCELCIKYPNGEYLSSICAFVRAASRSLKSLDIRIRKMIYSGWPAQLDVLPLTMPTLQIEMNCYQYDWHIGVMRWLLDSLTGADRPIMVETLTLVVVHLDRSIADDNDWTRQWLRLDEILTGPDMKMFRRLKVALKFHYSLAPSTGLDLIEWVHEKLPLLDKRNMLDVDITDNAVKEFLI